MYNGYLVEIDNVIFPLKYISIESYECTPNQTLDEDSFHDGDGVLNRAVLPHTRSKIEFNTPFVTESDLTIIRPFFKNRKRVNIRYYNMLTSNYETGSFYIPEPTFSVHGIINGKIIYKPIRIAMIEY